jgi:hypothetical protein
MRMTHRILCTIVVALCFCAVPFPKFLFVAAQVIPPVTGQLVDAISGKPIGGMGLTLQMSTYRGFSVHTEVKSTATSDLSGSFSLSGFKHPAETVLNEVRAYWLTVNEGLEATGQEESSAETQILYNPMSNRRDMVVGDTQYFPLTITFRHEGCARVWAAACMYMTSWSSIAVPVIPVLDDVKECNRIGNELLRENCRQLNTYRAAFVHVDSYEEVKKDKELCNEVDNGGIAKTCLWQLDLYVANPAHGYVRPMKPQVNEPIPEGMFPDSLAGLTVMKNKHCGPRLEFSGRVMCAAGYGSETKELVAVYIEEWPEEEQSTKPPTWKPAYTDQKEAAVTEELRPDGKVLRYRGPQYNSFYWHSSDRHVEVFFYYPIPQEEQFVSYYLAKFPSSFQ